MKDMGVHTRFNSEIFVYKFWRPKGFFKLKLSSMSLKLAIFVRQNLTFTDLRF